jgi:hypothetical protein
MLEQRGEGVGQYFVRTVADEDLLGPHLMVGCQSRQQRSGPRIRIEAQRIGRLATDCFQRSGGRTKRTFIGVQLDQLHQVGLLAWYVGPQVSRQTAPEAAHLSVQTLWTPQRDVRPARFGLWAEIIKQVRRHRLHIVAPPGVESLRRVLLARLADGEGRPVFRDDEFDLKPGSAVGDDDR